MYLHQDYLFAGLLISMVSAGLVVGIMTQPRSRLAPAPDKLGVVEAPAEFGADADSGWEQPAGPLTEQPKAGPGFWPRLRALAAGALLVAVAALTEIPRWREFRAEERTVEAETQCYLGICLHAQRQISQAVAHYTETLRLKPDHVMALCKLAWIRAAHPQAQFRNGPEAVRLARRACELTRHQAPAPLETLAAAYAEAGRFKDAAAIAEQARQMALAGGQPELAERPIKMLKLFAARKPYREADRN